VACGLAAAQIGFNLWFANRILPGIRVANVAVGGLTTAQAIQLLQTQVAAAHVRVVVGGKLHTLTLNQVGASYDVAASVADAMAVGRAQPWAPLQLWQGLHQGSLPLSYHLKPSTEQALANQLAQGSGPLPQNATIVVTGGVPAVQADQPGHRITPEAVLWAIQAQIADPGAEPVSLVAQTQAAAVSAAAAQAAIQPTKQIIATPVAITYQNQNFQPSPAQIGSWITFAAVTSGQHASLQPQVSSDAVKQYLQSIAGKINVAPVTRKVMVLNGISSEYQAGQNGVQLDIDTLAGQISDGLSHQQPLSLVAPTKTVAFQTQYNNSIAQPYDQYIEVNLSTQHLWAYQDHQVAYDSPVTSGATGAGFPTATGMFSILAKQTNRHLIGYQYGPRYNYDVFVQYWMPFYQGYGLHDASWRNGNFGETSGPYGYYYDGSHGCVNLPLATAAWLFNWSSVGTPVWVHN
jgi:lipoprotein-anchoring transpeptidase ErfK/SrfK